MSTSKSILLFTCLALASTACTSESAVTVGSDQRGAATATSNPGYVNATTDSPDFSKYKTYTWASQVTDPQNSSFFLNDLLFKGMVRDAVEHELATRGYTYQPSNGDLVVNFRSFDQPTEITSNDNLGAGYWAANEAYPYRDQNRVKLDKGSILVQLIDREKGEQVWQGYASGLTDGNVFDKNKDKVYVAIGQIFQGYNHRADKL